MSKNKNILVFKEEKERIIRSDSYSLSIFLVAITSEPV